MEALRRHDDELERAVEFLLTGEAQHVLATGVSAGSSGGGSSDPDAEPGPPPAAIPERLDRLRAMGFGAEAARHALDRADHDMNAAIELLFDAVR